MDADNARERSWAGLEDLRSELYGALHRHAQDPNEIEDVIQETLLRAARYRENLDDRACLRSWALRIARNVLADKKRRGGRVTHVAPGEPLWHELETRAEVPGDEETPIYKLGDRWIDRDDAVEHLTRVFERLRPDDRELLTSFYWQSASCRTIARASRIPAHLVKVRLYRARQRLCRALRRRIGLSGGRSAFPALEAGEGADGWSEGVA